MCSLRIECVLYMREAKDFWQRAGEEEGHFATGKEAIGPKP
jgi:hypothetical protein